MALPAQLKRLAEHKRLAPVVQLLARAGNMPRSHVYAIISVLLVVGLGTSLLDLSARSAIEQRYARKAEQQLLFDAKSYQGGLITPKNVETDDAEADESPEERRVKDSVWIRDSAKKTAESDARKVRNAAPQWKMRFKDGTVKHQLGTRQVEVPEKAPPIAGLKAGDSAGKNLFPFAVKEKQTLSDASLQAKAIDDISAQFEKEGGTYQGHSPAEQKGEDAVQPERGVQYHSEAAPLRQSENRHWDAIARHAQSLVYAPAREISKKTKWGPVPVIGERGSKASELYAKGHRPEEGKTDLAVLFINAGFSAESLRKILTLPRQVTVSFSPYVSDLSGKMQDIRNAGYETWIGLPVQSEDYPEEDPGPLGIVAGFPRQLLNQQLQRIMAISNGAVGMTFAPGHTLGQFRPILNYVVDGIASHGLHVFFPDKIIPRSYEGKVNLRAADVWVMPDTPPSKLQSQLNQLSKRLRGLEGTGRLVVVFDAANYQLDAVVKWLEKDVATMPVNLAPLSSIYTDFAAIAAEEEAVKAKLKKAGGGHH